MWVLLVSGEALVIDVLKLSRRERGRGEGGRKGEREGLGLVVVEEVKILKKPI